MIKGANKSFWNVKCDCGTEKTVLGVSLVTGNTTSCGCWNREKCWQGYEEISMSYWRAIIKGAERREVPFDLKIEEAWNKFIQQNRKCALTGRDLKFVRNHKRRHRIDRQTASLDRIDSNKGYNVNNIQWLNVDVNKMKREFNEKFFIELCKDVAKNN